MAKAKVYYESPYGRVVEAGPQHAGIAYRLRQADIDEVYASHGVSPEEAVRGMLESRGIKHAAELFGEPNGRVVAIYGIAKQYWGGEPWLLGTDELADVYMPFLRQSKIFIRRSLEICGTLANWVDARNELSIRWIRWLGFELGKPTPWGYEGRPFIPFRMSRR